jgi:hypothetical protein
MAQMILIEILSRNAAGNAGTAGNTQAGNPEIFRLFADIRRWMN